MPHIDTAAVDVVGDVLEARVIAEDQGEIAQGVFHMSLLVHDQLGLPVIVLFLGRLICKICLYLFHAFLCQLLPRSLVVRGVLTHHGDGLLVVVDDGAILGPAAGGKQVPAHQIEGVAQFAGAGICRVMGKGELVIIYHQAAHGRAVHVGVPAIHDSGRVE